MTVPHITIEQAKILCANPANADLWAANQNALIDVYNEKQSQEQYITAEEARKLGAGNAEYFNNWTNQWTVCINLCQYLPAFKYRAIKKPEPAEPHAELKAMYAKQVKAGTLDDFVWEYKNTAMSNEWRSVEHNLGVFHEVNQYRCTPKPTCQVKNIDTGELKTTTREAAKKLQAETKDMCDWFDPNSNQPFNEEFLFNATGIYAYKLKGTVKLTIDDEPAKMLTPAQCEAERLVRVDTHDAEVCVNAVNGWWHKASNFMKIAEYRLIRKKPELVEPTNEQFRIMMRQKLCDGAQSANIYQSAALKQPTPWTGSREDVIALLKEKGLV